MSHNEPGKDAEWGRRRGNNNNNNKRRTRVNDRKCVCVFSSSRRMGQKRATVSDAAVVWARRKKGKDLF